MSERVLTLRELNRATLARQLLLERAALAPGEAISHLVGLQAQMPAPPYIGLWTRLHDFRRADLSALLQQRQVVRATLQRATLHLLTADDYLLLRAALQPALTRSMQGFFSKQAKGLDVAPFVDAARVYVQERPRTFAEIRAHLVALFPETDPALLAYAVRMHLPLVQVPSSAAWGFAGNPAHELAETWLGRPLASEQEGLRALIPRYLAAFGPASVRDIQTWSGLTRLQSVFDELRPRLRTFRDEQGNELFDLPETPLPSAETPAPPRFLPEFDNLLLAHADRRRFVPDEYRNRVFLTVGRVRATLLIDGFVGGTWKIERARKTARLVIATGAPLADAVRAELLAEGERLVRFVEDSAETFEVQVTERN